MATGLQREGAQLFGLEGCPVAGRLRLRLELLAADLDDVLAAAGINAGIGDLHLEAARLVDAQHPGDVIVRVGPEADVVLAAARLVVDVLAVGRGIAGVEHEGAVLRLRDRGLFDLRVAFHLQHHDGVDRVEGLGRDLNGHAAFGGGCLQGRPLRISQ